MVHQLLQIFGSLLILTAYALSQAGRWGPTTRVYLELNVIGSALLAALAYLHHEWGFLLLEGVWALVSAYSLVRAAGADATAEVAD